ncbi:hypothetical protein I4U23_007401 [Adineta vaga]|nr:hypothetical protein I4U23_007401 [Adineta vaga]
MIRFESHYNAQTEWNEIKKTVKQKIVSYLDRWNKVSQPELVPPKKSLGKKYGIPKTIRQKRTFSFDDDPNRKATDSAHATLTIGKRKAPTEIDDLETNMIANETSWIVSQELILSDLEKISQRNDSLIQVESMGLLTDENQKILNKLIKQQQQNTSDLKRLQSRQRASMRLRERKKRYVEQLCIVNPVVADELTKVFRSVTTTKYNTNANRSRLS